MNGNKSFSLSALKGQRIVLYFYPRDNTPGCSVEAQEFSAAMKKFQKLGWEIYGVSKDSLESHEKFTKKFSIPFSLVSDPDEELCVKFDVMKMKSLYGKKFRGIERSTFLIDEKGKILREWRKVKVKDHVDEVLAAAKELA
ncbi:MAG: peroxiredoxin [Bdellovibrionota bacterium]